jgi:hypothetical protein
MIDECEIPETPEDLALMLDFFPELNSFDVAMGGNELSCHIGVQKRKEIDLSNAGFN